MAKSVKSWIVLLRAIGPATYKKMSMQQLREDCSAAGLEAVRTYIASGNLLCNSALSKNKLNKLIETILHDHGLDNDIIIRRVPEIKSVLDACPFPQAAKERPNHLLTVFFNHKLNTKAANDLLSRNLPERVAVLERELCIDYQDGVATSKLTPAIVERTFGQPGTARNWNTVEKLVALMDG